MFCINTHRVDEKTATDYCIEGGSVLHLVLALRGDNTDCNISADDICKAK